MMRSSTLSLLRQSLKNDHRRIQLESCRGMTVLSKESGEEFKKQNYTERMKKTQRPVSPHVTIYAFPITALTSITNRVTGVALSVGAVGLGTAELATTGGSVALMQEIATMGPVVSNIAKFS